MSKRVRCVRTPGCLAGAGTVTDWRGSVESECASGRSCSFKAMRSRCDAAGSSRREAQIPDAHSLWARHGWATAPPATRARVVVGVATEAALSLFAVLVVLQRRRGERPRPRTVRSEGASPLEITSFSVHHWKMFRFTRVSKQLKVAVRSFSASHEPPKKLFGHTGRYAMATYTAASKAGALEKVESELTSFAEVVKKNANLAAFLSNPTIPRSEKTNKVGGAISFCESVDAVSN